MSKAEPTDLLVLKGYPIQRDCVVRYRAAHIQRGAPIREKPLDARLRVGPSKRGGGQGTEPGGRRLLGIYPEDQPIKGPAHEQRHHELLWWRSSQCKRGMDSLTRRTYPMDKFMCS